MASQFTLGFDVYGTLIDTHGVITQLQGMVGNIAPDFSKTWRDKQLEYTFRRGLMGQYENFPVCTQQALEYTDQYYATGLSSSQKSALLAVYRELPAFADAAQALPQLQAQGHRLFAFSNGIADAVENLLVNAGIRQYFQGIVSVDDLKTFKPNPAVYQHFLQQAEAEANTSWLISGNPFDVLGALNVGMEAAWVKRSDNALFDPWETEPTMVISALSELANALR